MVDPQDPEAFTSAKLDWDERSVGLHRRMLDVYRTLLRLRREHPDLSDSRLDATEVEYDEDAGWLVIHRGDLDVVANISDSPLVLTSGAVGVLFSTHPGTTLQPAGVAVPARTAAILHV